MVSVRFRGRQGRVYYCRLSPQLCINKMIAPLSAIFIIFRSFDYLLAQFYTASNERHLSDNSPKNEYLLSVVDSFQQSLFVRTCPTKVDICHPLFCKNISGFQCPEILAKCLLQWFNAPFTTCIHSALIVNS